MYMCFDAYLFLCICVSISYISHDLRLPLSTCASPRGWSHIKGQVAAESILPEVQPGPPAPEENGSNGSSVFEAGLV